MRYLSPLTEAFPDTRISGAVARFLLRIESIAARAPLPQNSGKRQKQV
jgi:hypothetical protein